MRALALFLLSVVLASAGAAAARPAPRLVTALSQSRIDISYRFSGAELLVFGAIQYPGGRAPKDPPGIAVVLRGPAEPVTVRRKERVAGIWINTRSQRFETAPTFYAVATTAPLERLLDERNAAIYEIGLRHLLLSPSSSTDPDAGRGFESGLIGLRQRDGLYAEQAGGVTVTDGILYHARFPLPAAVPVGQYRAEIHLIDDGEVRASSTVPIAIEKSGFERGIYLFAEQHGLLYGLVAVGFALALGWMAGTIGRRSA
jgi:uncharacterized protein (TIGR02186 family)